MPSITYLPIEGYPGNPAFSEIAIIPPGSTWVLIGGQNAISTDRLVVGQGNAIAQAQVVRDRLDAALKSAGCTWNDVVRFHVLLAAGVDPRTIFETFRPVLATRPKPPLVSVAQVTSLAHPDFLLEISLEAARPPLKPEQ